MPIKRNTALKVRISDLTSGKWVKNEGMVASYVETASGMQVSRARLLGTIVSVFMAEDGMFASVTLDDSTDTIRVKTFKTVKPLDGFKVGDMVDLIGKVREWNDEIYVMPEIMRKVGPEAELLRRLEVAKKGKAPQEKQEPGENKDDLRKEVLKVIEAGKDGISYSDVLSKVKAAEETVEAVINELLGEGICYEPSPGKIRKI